jgi:hypothetical protein
MTRSGRGHVRKLAARGGQFPAAVQASSTASPTAADRDAYPPSGVSRRPPWNRGGSPADVIHLNPSDKTRLPFSQQEEETGTWVTPLTRLTWL